jgi:hypothetical protein
VGIFIIDKIIGMKKITDIEKQRILELHQNTPMKPFLFEQPTGFEVGPGGVIRPKTEFNPQQYKQSLVDKGINLADQGVKTSVAKPIYGQMPKGMTKQEIESAIKAEEKPWEPTHTQLEILALGSLFIPIIGPLLSTTFDAMDIEKYAKEGDYKSAGLFTLFLFIPFSQMVPNSIKKTIAKYTKDKLKNLVQRIFKGGVLNAEEKVLKDYIINNSPKMGDEISEIAKSKVDQLGIYGRGAEQIQLPPQALEQIGKFGLKGIKWVAPLIYIPAGWEAAWQSGDYLQRKIGDVVSGESLRSIMIRKGLDDFIVRKLFKSDGSVEEEKKLRDLLLLDEGVDNCGGWYYDKLVPIKYQTKKYKATLNEILPERITDYETVMKETPGGTDCRFEGTLGRPMKGKGNDPYEYKFVYGKYYTKLKDKENWIEVKDSKMMSAIEKIFTNAGLVKDPNNIAYMK